MKSLDKTILILICIAIGIFGTIQYRSVQNNYLEGLIPTKRSDQLKKELVDLREERARLLDQLAEREAELANVTENIDSENEILLNLQSQLERYRMLAGVTDVSGQGVIISLDNPIDQNAAERQASLIDNVHYIRMTINELNAAGAEVISINDERVLAQTEIRQVGEALYINGHDIKLPLVIKAIGNSEVLETSVAARFAIGEQLRSLGFQFDVRRFDKVDIDKYEDVLNWKYAHTVKELE